MAGSILVTSGAVNDSDDCATLLAASAGTLCDSGVPERALSCSMTSPVSVYAKIKHPAEILTYVVCLTTLLCF